MKDNAKETKFTSSPRPSHPKGAREFASGASLVTGVLAQGGAANAAEKSGQRNPLGVCNNSYGIAWRAAREGQAGAKFRDLPTFIDYCHELGATGVQIGLRPQEQAEAARIRAQVERLGMVFEGQIALPKESGDVDRFTRDLRALREAGATVGRLALLGTRRYESLHSMDEFRAFQKRAWTSLTLAEPIARREGIKLAIENHKDLLVHEQVEVMRKLSSTHVGACVDTGNSIALMEDPMAVVEALAPFAFSTHVKNMAVQEFERGFLLSEVAMGKGFLDLKKMVGILRAANPKILLSLEMITRDPLKIPYLEDGYWATLKEMPASQVAAALHRVKANASATPLPHTTGLTPAQQVELEDNAVRESFAWAKENL